jgi:hypothetical protein
LRRQKLPFGLVAQSEAARSSFSQSDGDFPLVVRFSKPGRADCLPDKGAQPRLSQFVRAGAQGSRGVFL